MADTSPRLRRAIWSWIVPTLLAALLLYYSLRGVQWGRVWTTIAGAHWQWLAAAGLITCLSSFLRSLRWRVLLSAAQYFDVLTVFWATMAGYLGNQFLPARAGELIRTFIISSRSSLSRTYVLTTALSERMMDAIALVLWSSVVLLGVHPKPAWLEQLSRTLAVAAGAGLLAVIIIPHTGNLCESVIRRLPLPARVHDKLVHFTQQILMGLKSFHDVRRFLTFAGVYGGDLVAGLFRGSGGGARAGSGDRILRGGSTDLRHGIGQRAALDAGLRRHLPVCRGQCVDAVRRLEGRRAGADSDASGAGLRGSGWVWPAGTLPVQGLAQRGGGTRGTAERLTADAAGGCHVVHVPLDGGPESVIEQRSRRGIRIRARRG